MLGDTVVVNVGERAYQKSFTVHRGILCFYSGYFEAALNGKFSEANNGVVELREETVDTFERFVFWLYTRKYDAATTSADGFHSICELWLFADRRQVPLLANVMINAMRDGIVKHWIVPTNEVELIYNNTTEGPPLRQFIVWVISNTIPASEAMNPKGRAALWPAEFLRDILKSVWTLRDSGSKRLSKQEVANVDMCTFHQHEEGVKCPVRDGAET